MNLSGGPGQAPKQSETKLPLWSIPEFKPLFAFVAITAVLGFAGSWMLGMRAAISGMSALIILALLLLAKANAQTLQTFRPLAKIFTWLGLATLVVWAVLMTLLLIFGQPK